MKDHIPTKVLVNGAIRYGVYDDAGNFLRYEYIKLEDEPTQEGDPLCKATLLPDDVAAVLGLTGNPQVKDALAKLSGAANPLQYVWDKYDFTETFKDGSYSSDLDVTILANNALATTTIIYGDAFTYTYPNGPYVILNPTTIELSYSNASNYSNVLNGKYWCRSVSRGSLCKGAGTLMPTQMAGPNFGVRMPAYQVVRTVTQSYIGEVASWAEGAYPSDGIIGNYRYTFKGRPQYVGIRIETGSYTGTGTVGSSTPNRLTFSFTPKLLFLFGTGSQMSEAIVTVIAGITKSVTAYQGGSIAFSSFFTFLLNGVSWYGTGSDPGYQYNVSGKVYQYLAIG